MLPVKAAMRDEILSSGRARCSSASRRRTSTRILRSSVRLIEPEPLCSDSGDNGSDDPCIVRTRVNGSGSSVCAAVGIERVRHAGLHALLILLLLDGVVRRLDAGVLRGLAGLFPGLV